MDRDLPRSANANSIEQAYRVEKDLRIMTDAELKDYIHTTLLPHEDRKYKGSQNNTAEHKLLFLTGGPARDVTIARTHKGEFVYMNPPDHPKDPEIVEATSAISDHFNIKENLPHVLSEIGDVFYNLEILIERDPEYTMPYERVMRLLSTSSGLSLRDALLISAVKFKRRMEMGKDPDGEEVEIAKLIQREKGRPSIIHEPSRRQLTETHRNLNIIESSVLTPRLNMIATLDNLDGGIWA